MPTKLYDPFGEDVECAEIYHNNIRADQTSVDIIKSVLPGKRTMRRITNLFLHSIVQTIKQNKLTYDDRERLENYILERCTPSDIDSEGRCIHDAGRTASAPRPARKAAKKRARVRGDQEGNSTNR